MTKATEADGASHSAQLKNIMKSPTGRKLHGPKLYVNKKKMMFKLMSQFAGLKENKAEGKYLKT